MIPNGSREAFERVEVVSTIDGQEMEAQHTAVALQGCIELVRSMDAASITDHDDLFAGFAEGRHHLVQILTQLLGIKVKMRVPVAG